MNILLFKKDFIYRFLQTFFKQTLTAFIYFYAANQLDPNLYGQGIYYISISSLLLIFCDFGISTSVTKFIAENKYKCEILIDKVFSKTIILIFILTSTILTIFIVLNESKIFQIQSINQTIYTLSPYIIFTPVNSSIDGYLLGKRKFLTLFKINLLYFIISIGVNFFLIKNYMLNGLLLTLSINATTLFAIYIFTIRKKISISLPDKSIRQIISYSIIIGITSISYFLYSRIDIFILKYFSFTSEIAYYEVINRVFSIIIIPFAIYGQVLSPKLAEIFTNKQTETVINFYQKNIICFLAIGIAISGMLYLTLPFIIQTFYPAYYNKNFITIMIILLGVLPLKILGVISTIGFITPSGYAKITMKITFIFGVINSILDIILIQIMGFEGIFWATFVAHNAAIIFQITLFYTRLKYGKNI